MSAVSRGACTASSEVSQCAKEVRASRSVEGSQAGTCARGSWMTRVWFVSLPSCFNVDKGQRPGEEEKEVGGGVVLVTYVFWGLFTCADGVMQA